MITEKVVSILQFDQLMKNGLKDSFEKSIKDLRGHPVSYEDILDEASKDKRTTKIALTYEDLDRRAFQTGTKSKREWESIILKTIKYLLSLPSRSGSNHAHQ